MTTPTDPAVRAAAPDDAEVVLTLVREISAHQAEGQARLAASAQVRALEYVDFRTP